MSILLLNGPPFSPLFWDKVQDRLSEHNLKSASLNWIEQSGTMETLVPWIIQTIEREEHTTLVAHGLAVPLALEIASQKQNIHFILSNGPLDSHKLALFLSTIPRLSLHPKIALPILSSSLAFRRLVINPYVMNRDTIATLSNNVLNNRKVRGHIWKYFQDLRGWHRPKNLTGQEISLIWGTSDFLFPPPADLSLPNRVSYAAIEGGAHFHPIERPWAIADQIQKISMTKMS